MPSPFPGMNPYLENPELWRGVHHWLISQAASQLQPQLNPRGYYVDIESRVWLERSPGAVIPDVALSGAGRPGPGRPEEQAGAILVADEPVRIRAQEVEVREDYLEIRQRPTGRLVAGIEFISPSNKSDRKTRSLYLDKRRKLRLEGVHLVEVDLLRQGRPLVRLPGPVLEKIQPGGYVINIVRADSPDYEFFAAGLRSRLPRAGIPLDPDVPDCVLDLQAAVLGAYDAGAYHLRIDYARDPIPPLSPADDAWARGLLIAAGLRMPTPPETESPTRRTNGPS